MWWGMGIVSVLYVAVNVCFVGPSNPGVIDLQHPRTNSQAIDDHRPGLCATGK